MLLIKNKNGHTKEKQLSADIIKQEGQKETSNHQDEIWWWGGSRRRHGMGKEEIKLLSIRWGWVFVTIWGGKGSRGNLQK